MRVVVLYDDDAFVSYSMGSLEPVNEMSFASLDEACAGQVNGLLGTAIEGSVSWSFGLYAGPEPLRIEWSDSEPEIGDEWEDIVEASATFALPEQVLHSFDDLGEIVLPVSGPHRLRFSASGMDAAASLESRDADDDVAAPDRYLLQLWPAASAPDLVVRQGSDVAARLHREATGQAHPPSPEEAELKQLQDAFAAAPVDAQVEALAQLMELVIAATELDGNPDASAVPNRVRRRESRAANQNQLSAMTTRFHDEAPPVTRRGDDWMKTLGWRRFQAGIALSSAVGQPVIAVIREAQFGGNTLFHARLALGEQWPHARGQTLQSLDASHES